MPVVLGVEEEVFICEPERPTMRSLYFLAKLLAKRPRYYYTHSAHNFARGRDVRQGLMSGVEVSTGMHEDIDALLSDLSDRRADLASVTDGLIVPVGHLFDVDAPTNTCAIHVHVSGVPDPKRLYNNLIHFLPVLPLFTINSPIRGGDYFGQSYRMAKSWAVGPIRQDWTHRFQDIICSKRLGTIELRACDPCWDLSRIRLLLQAVKAIAELQEDLEPRTSFYNWIRPEVCRRGLIDENAELVEELRSIVPFPEEVMTQTASDELWQVYEAHGQVAAYSALDGGYRHGRFEPREVDQKQKSHAAMGLLGFAAYFVPRLPYYAWKGIKEN
jgi:gamma-glutamyl:cysteine ligase YbdK (ATP-grasp superfamily)